MDFNKLFSTLLIFGLSYWFYKKLVADGVIGQLSGEPADVAYKTGTKAIPVGFNPNNLAKEADQLLSTATALTDTHIFDDRTALYGKLLSLTDDQLILTYNTFKKLFYVRDRKTLTQRIDSTWDNLFAHGKIRNELLVRLRMLNCK